MPRFMTSSAISQLVHWLMGRPESPGSSQAMARIWRRWSAVIRAGVPGRGRSSSRSAIAKSSKEIGCNANHRSRHCRVISTVMPNSRAIFAVGSCGTFAGLLLGARLAGLDSRIVGVRVIEEDVANRIKIARMVNRTARCLQRRDRSVPEVEVEPEEVDLQDGYLGAGYAHPTAEAQRAVELVVGTEGLPLEATYTGKAMAALLDHARRHPRAQLLFVNTFAEAPALEEGEWRGLPERFWPVFDPAHRVACWGLRSRQDPDFCWKNTIE